MHFVMLNNYWKFIYLRILHYMVICYFTVLLINCVGLLGTSPSDELVNRNKIKGHIFRYERKEV